jgi:hypothetical protein
MKPHVLLQLRLAAVFGALLAAPPVALAQTDEIQVYNGGIAEVGVFNLTWHNNFTPSGVKTPGFPGGLVNNRNLNGVTEWAWGVTEWFEAGLYLPLYSVSAERGATINGGKIRLLFAEPHADDRKFVYAVNFEFSYNSKHWEDRRYTSEIRPIIGWHLKPWDIFINPILDNRFVGGIKSLDFAPASRLGYNLNDKWAIALEEYDDFGPLRNFAPVGEQFHQIWGVVDHGTKHGDFEAGIGFGLNDATDKVSLKLMWSIDFNPKTK